MPGSVRSGIGADRRDPFRRNPMPPLRGLPFFAVEFYKASAPDGAAAAVTNDDASSLFSGKMPTGDNGGNREIST
jgi:hypothetical protein